MAAKKSKKNTASKKPTNKKASPNKRPTPQPATLSMRDSLRVTGGKSLHIRRDSNDGVIMQVVPQRGDSRPRQFPLEIRVPHSLKALTCPQPVEEVGKSVRSEGRDHIITLDHEADFEAAFIIIPHRGSLLIHREHGAGWTIHKANSVRKAPVEVLAPGQTESSSHWAYFAGHKVFLYFEGQMHRLHYAPEDTKFVVLSDERCLRETNWTFARSVEVAGGQKWSAYATSNAKPCWYAEHPAVYIDGKLRRLSRECENPLTIVRGDDVEEGVLWALPDQGAVVDVFEDTDLKLQTKRQLWEGQYALVHTERCCSTPIGMEFVETLGDYHLFWASPDSDAALLVRSAYHGAPIRAFQMDRDPTEPESLLRALDCLVVEPTRDSGELSICELSSLPTRLGVSAGGEMYAFTEHHRISPFSGMRLGNRLDDEQQVTLWQRQAERFSFFLLGTAKLKDGTMLTQRQLLQESLQHKGRASAICAAIEDTGEWALIAVLDTAVTIPVGNGESIRVDMRRPTPQVEVLLED